MTEWYTQQEVADKLGISKSTVYNYHKQGKIKKIADPYRMHKEARYEKEEVDQLAAERNEQPEGMSPPEVAKLLGLHVQTIYKYIKDGIIEAEEKIVGEEKTVYVISRKAFEEAERTLKPMLFDRIRRSEYYLSSKDIALFQNFNSSLVQTARVTKDLKHNWGFYFPISQKWVSYEDGINQFQLKPSYPIHQDTIAVKGYVYLKIPFHADILYHFIDYLYHIWGIENVGIREQGESVLISIKVGEKPFDNLPFSVEQLQPYVIEGYIGEEDGLFITRSSYRKTNLEIAINLLASVKKLSEKENTSISQWIEVAIAERLEREGNLNEDEDE